MNGHLKRVKINKLFKNGGIIFELMERDYNTSRLRCRSCGAYLFNFIVRGFESMHFREFL